SRLLVRQDRHVPLSIFQRIRRRNENRFLAVVFWPNKSKNLGRFRRHSDATARAPDDVDETCQPPAIAKLLRNLVETGLLERDRDGSLFLIQFRQCLLRRFEIAAQQKQHRTVVRNGELYVAMERTAGARGESVKVDRRVRRRIGLGWMFEILFAIPPARAEHGQLEIGCVVRRRHGHCSSSSDGGGVAARNKFSSRASSSGPTGCALRISAGVVAGSRRSLGWTGIAFMTGAFVSDGVASTR